MARIAVTVSIAFALSVSSTLSMAGGDDDNKGDKRKDFSPFMGGIHDNNKGDRRKDFSPFMVVDANGKTVGRYGGGPGNAFAQIEVQGKSYAVRLDTHRSKFGPGSFQTLLTYGFNALFFRGFDCTGEAAVKSIPSVGMPQAAVVSNGGISNERFWLYPLAATTHGDFLANSAFVEGSCLPPSSYPPINGGDFTQTSGPPIEITNLFTLPFTVE